LNCRSLLRVRELIDAQGTSFLLPVTFVIGDFSHGRYNKEAMTKPIELYGNMWLRDTFRQRG
jgi:hypothetical protein